MRISYVEFTDAIRIQKQNGCQRHNHLDDSMFDLVLINDHRLEVKTKGKVEIKAIVPFQQCRMLVPLDQPGDWQALEDSFLPADDDDQATIKPLLEVPTQRKVKHGESNSRTKAVLT